MAVILSVGANLLSTDLAPVGVPPIYECPYCGATFYTQAELDRHIELVHGVTPPPPPQIDWWVEMEPLVPSQASTIRLTVQNKGFDTVTCDAQVFFHDFVARGARHVPIPAKQYFPMLTVRPYDTETTSVIVTAPNVEGRGTVYFYISCGPWEDQKSMGYTVEGIVSPPEAYCWFTVKGPVPYDLPGFCCGYGGRVLYKVINQSFDTYTYSLIVSSPAFSPAVTATATLVNNEWLYGGSYGIDVTFADTPGIYPVHMTVICEDTGEVVCEASYSITLSEGEPRS